MSQIFRPIGFAHLTLIGDLSDAVEHFTSTGSPDVIFKSGKLPNPPQKLPFQLNKSSMDYEIQILDSWVPIEVITFDGTRGERVPHIRPLKFLSSAKLTVIGSASFDSEFASDFRRLLGVNDLTLRQVFGQRQKLIEFREHNGGSKFSEFLDEPNSFASIGVFVSGLSAIQLPSQMDYFRVGVTQIALQRFDILFVRCGSVWVELLERKKQ